MDSPVTRPALGNLVGLGALYDARTDTFLPDSLFEETPEDAVDTKINIKTTAELAQFTRLRDRLSFLGISPELGASILTGLTAVDGCGLYLTDRPSNSDNVAQGALHFTFTTIDDQLNLTASGVKEQIPADTLDIGKATHVVTGITWGAQFVVTACQSASNPEDLAKLQQCLDSDFANLKDAVLDGNHPSMKSQEPVKQEEGGNIFRDCEISILSNIMPPGNSIPASLATPSALVNRLRTYIRAVNGGKGQPIQYTLMPLSLLAMLRLIEIEIHPAIKQPNVQHLNTFIDHLNDWSDAQHKLKNYVLRCERHETAIPPNELSVIKSRPRAMQTADITFKTSFGHTLQKFRDGKESEGQLQELLCDAENHELAPKNMFSIMSYNESLDFVEQITNLGAIYLGYQSTPLNNILSQQGQDIYVLNFNYGLRDSLEWAETIELFLELLHNNNKWALILAVDCEAVGQLLDKVFITHYLNSRVLVDDVLEHRKVLASNCIMRYDEDAIDISDTNKPVQRRPVKVPCPHPSCDKTLACQWLCSTCRCIVEFAHVGDRLYCNCGSAPFDRWNFKCQDQNHGPSYTRYERPVLLQLLNNLKPFNELNILILGETGVGKSTWINAFVNYVTYDTLEEALQEDELKWVIPCSFSTQLKDDTDGKGKFVQKDIRIGSSQSEKDGARGQSATQSTNVYTVDIGNTRVRLIDTPGIGDTRGFEQDNKNMANILQVLRTYKKLHGIMILLKPNASRLTVMFRFCIKQLLTQLHKNAATNIVFGFTNTRGSNYKPGDTFKPLDTLLNAYTTVELGLYEHNVYCFDSESFRYLAAQKKGIEMGYFEDNTRSWEHSVAECKRLVKYVEQLTPHNVRSTLNLNETRDMIVKLTEPMAVIAQKIASSIAVNNDAINHLKTEKLSRAALEKSLYVQRDSVESYEVDQPRTVCTHHDCVEVRSDFQGRNESVIVYKQMCHVPCHLGHVVKRNTKGDEGLRNCWAMDGGEFCHLDTCGHHYLDHMHIYYDYRPMSYQYRDEGIAKDLMQRKSDIELKQKAIDMKNEAVEEFQLEYAQIQEAAIQFGFFLKRHAIEPYNDATVEYVDHLIDQEKLKIKSGGKKDTLEMLEKYKAEHLQKIQVLTKAMERGDTDEVLDDIGVRNLVDSLYKLPHFGGDLQKIVRTNEAATDAAVREKSYNVSAGQHWDARPKAKKHGRGVKSKHEAQTWAHSNKKGNARPKIKTNTFSVPEDDEEEEEEAVPSADVGYGQAARAAQEAKMPGQFHAGDEEGMEMLNQFQVRNEEEAEGHVERDLKGFVNQTIRGLRNFVRYIT